MKTEPILAKYFPNINSEAAEKLQLFHNLFLEVNAQLNLISRKDTENLWERHIIHSLSILKFFTFTEGSKLLDLGTGGGLPGLPLAIMLPNCDFVLCDSITKKCNAVFTLAEELDLENVTVMNQRAENLKTKFDFVVSRAVAPVSDLMRWTQNIYAKQERNSIPNGLIALKGGDLSEELKPYKRFALIENLKTKFDEEFFETKKIVYIQR